MTTLLAKVLPQFTWTHTTNTQKAILHSTRLYLFPAATPQTWWLKTMQVYYLTPLEVRGQNESHWKKNQGVFLLETPGENLSIYLIQFLEAASFLDSWSLPIFKYNTCIPQPLLLVLSHLPLILISCFFPSQDPVILPGSPTQSRIIYLSPDP